MNSITTKDYYFLLVDKFGDLSFQEEVAFQSVVSPCNINCIRD